MNNVANRTAITQYQFSLYSDLACATSTQTHRGGGSVLIRPGGILMCSNANAGQFALVPFACSQGAGGSDGRSLAITGLAYDGGPIVGATGNCVVVNCGDNTWSVVTPQTITTQ